MLVALFTVVLAVVGLVSPDSVTAVRRHNFATPTGLYTAGAVRLVMGLVVILAATASRAPKTLRLLGALMCMQGLSATILGPEHARTVLEWETMRPALLRAGAISGPRERCLHGVCGDNWPPSFRDFLTAANVAFMHSDFKGAHPSCSVPGCDATFVGATRSSSIR